MKNPSPEFQERGFFSQLVSPSGRRTPPNIFRSGVFFVNEFMSYVKDSRIMIYECRVKIKK